MLLRPPISSLPDTLVPSTTLFRSLMHGQKLIEREPGRVSNSTCRLARCFVRMYGPGCRSIYCRTICSGDGRNRIGRSQKHVSVAPFTGARSVACGCVGLCSTGALHQMIDGGGWIASQRTLPLPYWRALRYRLITG